MRRSTRPGPDRPENVPTAESEPDADRADSAVAADGDADAADRDAGEPADPERRGIYPPSERVRLEVELLDAAEPVEPSEADTEDEAGQA